MTPATRIDPSRLRDSDRADLRAAMGVADSTLLVVALGDPPACVQALEALLGVGLARETGRDLVVVLSPSATGISRAQGVMRDVARGRSLIVHDAVDRPWEILPACDAALVTNDGPSAEWARAARLPIFSGTAKAGRIAQELCRFHDQWRRDLTPPSAPPILQHGDRV